MAKKGPWPYPEPEWSRGHAPCHAQVSGGTNGACDGAYTIDLASYWAASPGALGAPLSAGDVIDVQAWFRDPAGPGTTHLSGGVEFVLAP